jgi:hypothetical protein
MACPFFLPTLPSVDFVCEQVPLGDLYGGQCAADRNALIPDETLRRCCNMGYARTACPTAALAEADAARYLIAAERGGMIDVAWALERNHHPVAVGTLHIRETSATSDEPLERQAQAYAATYLRRTGRT